MPPVSILDPATLDCNHVLFSREQIYRLLPQQYEFSQLDAIIHIDVPTGTFAAYRDVRPDEWWCRGHMPQQPIFPGVLMVESAAQLSSFAQSQFAPTGDDSVMGFGGIDRCKFRDSVFPPARVILVGRATDLRIRKFTCDIQGFVDGKMVFEAEIAGIRLKL